MKLHEAIEKVLTDNNRPMTARELANEINRQSLYQRGDGASVPSSQISARVNNYPSLFAKEGGRIYLTNLKANSQKENFIESRQITVRPPSFPFRQKEKTLHQAIDLVLKRHQKPMSASEIAEEINKTNLYQRNDGNPVPTEQIHARVKNYGQLFSKTYDGKIERLKSYKEDLIELAMQLQTIISDQVRLLNKILKFSHLIVPFIFISRRLLENPELIEKHLFFKIKGQFSESYFDLFLEKIQANKELPDGLSELAADFKELLPLVKNLLFEGEFLSCNLSLNKINSADFGYFFNQLIFKISKQEQIAGKFYTPEVLSELFYGLLKPHLNKNISVYNPGTGFGTLPAKIAQNASHSISFTGEEIVKDVYLLALMNLIANDISITNFRLGSSLDGINQSMADIAISIPPLSGRNQPHVPIYPVSTSEIVLQFIQECVLSLRTEGKALILVPENVLYSSQRDFIALRRFLFNNRFFEGVISLPQDILQPATAIKTSLLILSKKHNNSIRFVDAEEFHLKEQFLQNEHKLLISKICRLYQGDEEGESVHGSMKAGSTPYTKIDSERLILFAKRNFLLEELDEKYNTRLQDIVEPQYIGRRCREGEKHLCVNIADLNNDPNQIYLDLEGLETKSGNPRFRVYEEPGLLISKLPNYPKPSYYRGERPIMVSQNIHFFKLKIEVVDPEYLIGQLNTDYIKRRLDAIATGITSLRTVNRKDLLKVRIMLSNLDEQRKSLDQLRNPERTTKISIPKSEKILLDFFEHEFGNIASGSKIFLENIKGFLSSKFFDLNEKIASNKHSISIGEMFDRLIKNMDDISTVAETLTTILNIISNTTKKKLINIRELIYSECNKISILQELDIKVLISDEELILKNKQVLIDPDQFAILIKSILMNAIKHGFHSNETPEKYILFKLSYFDGFNTIDVINNGNSFPDGFTIKKFSEYGGRHDHSSGSGLGGFIICKVVENHSGTIEILPNEKIYYINELNSKPITIGAHFQIKFPNL